MCDARRPAAEQAPQFHDLGWPSGPPSADELMQLLLARAKRELSAGHEDGEHHREPVFARSQSAHDRAMHKIEKTEPKIEFDVDDPNRRGRTTTTSTTPTWRPPKGAPRRCAV